MKINRELLPVKAHFFFFMAAMGPILPQIPVYGKELGISSVVMGTVSGILPIIFLLAKPAFGIIVDIFRNQRKIIFMSLICAMSTSFAILYFIPANFVRTYKIENVTCDAIDVCNALDLAKESFSSHSLHVICQIECTKASGNSTFKGLAFENKTDIKICVIDSQNITCATNCTYKCHEDIDHIESNLYASFTFWGFIFMMSLGNICYNVANSISDAICFDVIGEKYDYGKQRVWGAVGFGLTALLGGYLVDSWNAEEMKSYTPAFVIMITFTAIDLFACKHLKLPVIEPPKNIFKDLCKLFSYGETVVFLAYAVFAGVIDSFIIYFLFWYLEDLALETQTSNVKLLEGLIVAAETLGGEILFFSISGKILSKMGHADCFSLCFVHYALRLIFISMAPSPWWILPVELVMQGPTYALTYTTIVAYANAIAPPGMSATMQGIAAGLDDGFGYAIGCITVGILYNLVGGRRSLQIFSLLALLCGISHFTIHKIFLTKRDSVINQQKQGSYESPEQANLSVTSP